MFRKSTIIVVALSAITLTSCGNTSTSSNTTEETSIESVANIEVANEETSIEETSAAEETLEPEYEEYDDFYQNKNFVWSGDLILDYQSLDPKDYQVKFEDVDGYPIYGIYDSINIYEANGEINGYTKPNIIVQLCATSEDGWGVVNIGDYTKYIKMQDMEDNSVLITETDNSGHYVIPEKESEEETTTVENNNNTTEKTSETETPSETSVDNSSTTVEVEVEEKTQVAEASDKYTPDEAIAAYRAIMESNGIKWDPSLPSDGASWGTGWLELNKDYVKWAANTDVESFQMGDGDGEAWTRYYFEITSVDEDSIYITSWHG